MKIVLHMIRILSVFCISLFVTGHMSLLYADQMSGKASSQPLVVVELFTSQGCSSCPPADELLARLSRQKNILALGFSVDYWNYLGWKDTLARPDCTIRQKKYNKSLGKSGVYTPQMIIQGRHDVIGSRENLVQNILDQTRTELQAQHPGPRIIFAEHGDMIDLKIGAGVREGDVPATIWVIGYDFERTVNIKKGEMAGQVRKYRNVVQSIKHIGHWTGKEIKLALSKDNMGERQYDGYALILQNKETGPIIAAAKLK